MRWVSVAMVCLLSLVGCSRAPQRADTLPVAEEPSQSLTATAKVPVAAPVDVEANGRLTTAQAKKALLTLDDMPTGWAQDRPDPNTDDPSVTPDRCSAILNALNGQGRPLARANASFNAGGFGPQLEQSVTSWPKSQLPILKKLTDAFRQCPKFTSTSKDGSSATFQAGGLSFPNVGDRTLALRLKAKTDGIDFVLDLVYIAKGNNGITLVVSGLQPLGGATLESLARKAVAHLDAAAR
jgi:hypothetical protein